MAIAYDSAEGADGGIAITNTYSHTNTGTDLVLTTGAIVIQSPTPTATATYAGASMTQAALNSLISNNNQYIFYKASPSTGANNVITTASASARNFGGSISLTGCDTSSPIGATNTANGTSTTPSVSITTTRANSWIVALLYINDTLVNTSPTATGTNQTQRYTILHSVGGVSAVGSTQTTTTIGSYTSSWTLSTSTAWSVTVVEIYELPPNYTLTAGTGTFTLAGQAVSFGQALIAAVGSFTVAMQSVLVRFSGWTNQTKNTSSFTNQTKNTSSFTNQSKNSDSWTNQNKN